MNDVALKRRPTRSPYSRHWLLWSTTAISCTNSSQMGALLCTIGFHGFPYRWGAVDGYVFQAVWWLCKVPLQCSSLSIAHQERPILATKIHLDVARLGFPIFEARWCFCREKSLCAYLQKKKRRTIRRRRRTRTRPAGIATNVSRFKPSVTGGCASKKNVVVTMTIPITRWSQRSAWEIQRRTWRYLHSTSPTLALVLPGAGWRTMR